MKSKTLPSIFCGLLFLTFFSTALGFNSFWTTSENLEISKANFDGICNAYSCLVLFSAVLLLYGYYAFYKKNEIGPLIFFAVVTALSQYCISLVDLLNNEYFSTFSAWQKFLCLLRISITPLFLWFIFSLISLSICDRNQEQNYTPNDFYFWSTLFLLAVSLLFTTREYSIISYYESVAILTIDIGTTSFFRNTFFVLFILLLFFFQKKRGLYIFSPIAVTLISICNFFLLYGARFAYFEYTTYSRIEYFESTAFNTLFGLLFTLFYATYTVFFVKAVIHQKINPSVKLSVVESMEEKVQQLSYIEQLLNDGILNYTEFKYLKSRTLNEKERYSPLTNEYLRQLDSLKNLLGKNILTEEEFIREKRKLLGLPIILVENDNIEATTTEKPNRKCKISAIKSWDSKRTKKALILIGSIVLAAIFIISVILIPIIANKGKETTWEDSFETEVTTADFSYTFEIEDYEVCSYIIPKYDFADFSFTIIYYCSNKTIKENFYFTEATANEPLICKYAVELLENQTGEQFTRAVIDFHAGKKQNKYQTFDN